MVPRMLDDAELVVIAREAAQKAYAPYSHFYVGAALQALDGQVFTGCNVENASLGLTICAERVAICNAVQQGCRTFSAIAIVATQPATPCGACRQVLAEFTQPQFRVIVASMHAQEEVKVYSMEKLLPHQFVLMESTQKENT